MSSFASNLPASAEGWLDPALLPMYLAAGLALFISARWVDKTFIRPPSKTGFGKGAPGFMTNTRKLKVTPEIAARLRAGEQVSPEEIAAAVAAAEARDAANATGTSTNEDTEPDSPSPKRRVTRSQMKKKPIPPSKHVAPVEEPKSDVNEWIPEAHLKKPATRRKSQR